MKSVRWVALGSSGVPFRLVLVSGLDRDPMGLSLKGDNLSWYFGLPFLVL